MIVKRIKIERTNMGLTVHRITGYYLLGFIPIYVVKEELS